MASQVHYVCYIDETGFYLGDMEQIIEQVGLDVDPATLAASGWVPAHADGMLSLIRCANVQSLWMALGVLAYRFRQLNKSVECVDQTVHLFMPCGVTKRYIAFDDLPWESMPCHCGNPNHWLFYYTDEMEPADTEDEDDD